MDALPQPVEPIQPGHIQLSVRLVHQGFTEEKRVYPRDITICALFRLLRFEHSKCVGTLLTARLSVPYHVVEDEFCSENVPDDVGLIEVARDFELWEQSLGDLSLNPDDTFQFEFTQDRPFSTRSLQVGSHIVFKDEFGRWYHSYIMGERTDDEGTWFYVQSCGFKSTWNEWVLSDSDRFKPLGTDDITVDYKWFQARPHTDFEDEEDFYELQMYEIKGEGTESDFMQHLEEMTERRRPELPEITMADMRRMLRNLYREKRKLNDNCDSLKSENKELVKKMRITKLNLDLQAIDLREAKKNVATAEAALRHMSGHDLDTADLPTIRSLRDRVLGSLTRINEAITEKEIEEHTCSICTEGAKSHCLVPCGHRFCADCIPRLNRCPICRAQFFQFVEIF